MARFFREDFDRDRSFVVLRSFTFLGQGYVPNQAIDKSRFTVRRLRQLYDMRNIGYGDTPVAPVVVPRRAPTPTQPVAKQPVARYRPRRVLNDIAT